MLFNDRRANARALKAAKGPSLAPKGYKPDTEARTIAQNQGEYFTRPWKSRKSAMAEAAKFVSENRGGAAINYAPNKNAPGKVNPETVRIPREPKDKKGR